MTIIIVAIVLLYVAAVVGSYLAPNPTFVGAGEFLTNVQSYQTVSIVGRYGRSKTLTSMILASKLYTIGAAKRLYANIPSILCERDLELPVSDAVFIVDECQNFLQLRQSAVEAAAYLRKDGIIVIQAGIDAPYKLLDRLRLSVDLSLIPFGIDCIIYKWRAVTETRNIDGRFAIIGTKRAYFFYDTLAKPIDDGGLARSLEVNQIVDNAIRAGMSTEQIERIIQELGSDNDNTTDDLGQQRHNRAPKATKVNKIISTVAETVENTSIEIEQLQREVAAIRADSRKKR